MNEKELDQRIAETRPYVPEGDQTEELARSRAGSLLRAEIAQADQRHRKAPGRRLVLRGALALAAVAAVVIGLELGLPGEGGKKGPPVAAAATLKEFANLVAAGPSKPLKPGQYYYLRTVSGSGLKALKTGAGGYSNAVAEEIWIGSDGSGRVLSPGAAPERYSSGKPMPLLRFQGVKLDYRGLLALPANPKALLRWLERRTVGDGPEAQDVQLGMISELLGRTPAPPKLRAALYRLIGSFSGVKTEGRVRDPLGRIGFGFKRHMDGCKLQPEATCEWEIILEPKMGSWLASRRFLSNGGPSWSATVESGVVNSLHARP
ncbi:MAG: CU044_5270 family protein [Gaiellaceae bacterium]